MNILFNSKFLLHNESSDVEGTYRLREFAGKVKETHVDGEQYLTLIHPPEYIQQIKEACLNYQTLAEVQLTPDSWEAMKLGVGLTVYASLHGDFALVRPPGHHATRDRAMGFCFFNNVAIATQFLLNRGKRVFILDIDGHHGNGTQDIFYGSSQAFYCSIHQLYAYPFTGFPNETGDKEGQGYNLNIPMIAGSGDKEFTVALDKALGKAIEFNPDVMAVSAGFDSYEHDRLLGLKLSQKAYYECALRIRRSFSEVFAVLEGGYHNDMEKCIKSFVEGIHIGERPRRNLFDHNMSIG